VQQTTLMSTLIKERRTRRRKAICINTPTPGQLLNEVCHILDLNPNDVKSGRRFTRLVKGKSMFLYLGRSFGFQIADMGRLVKMNHSSVLYHLNGYDDLLDKSKMYYDGNLAQEVRLMKDKLRSRLINCL